MLGFVEKYHFFKFSICLLLSLWYLQRCRALIAQLVEHLICNQGVGSSSLSGGTTFSLCITNLLFLLGVFLGGGSP